MVEVDGKLIVLPRVDFQSTLSAIIKAKEKGEADKVVCAMVAAKEEYLKYVAKLMDGLPDALRRRRQCT